jgi:hypothetical protein
MTSGFRLLTAYPQVQVVNFSIIGKVNFYMFVYSGLRPLTGRRSGGYFRRFISGRELLGRQIAKRAVRTVRVVSPNEFIEDHFGFPQAREQFPVERFIPQFPVETLDEWILPRTTRRDEHRLRAQLPEPGLNGPRNELRTVVRPDEVGYPPLGHRQTKHLHDRFGLECPPDLDGQAFPGIFIHQRQQLQFPPISGLVKHEIV